MLKAALSARIDFFDSMGCRTADHGLDEFPMFVKPNEYAANEAMKTALPSHCHREGIRGAQCVATLIYWLRTVRITKDEVIGTVKQTFGYDIPDLKEVYRLGNEGHFDATCQETVPAAISCFLDSNNFEDAIRTAILAQGDTDTKGAICGSIAEAYYEIPEEMITKAYEYLPADMLEIVDQFYTTLQGHIKR